MPMLVALSLLYLCGSHQERKDYWQRLIDFRRISKTWYAVVFLTVPTLTAIGIVIDIFLGGIGAELEAASNILSNPLSLFFSPFLCFYLAPCQKRWRGVVTYWMAYKQDGLHWLQA